MTQTTTNGLLQLRASELLPGDRVSFGDHTGWYRVLEAHRTVTDQKRAALHLSQHWVIDRHAARRRWHFRAVESWHSLPASMIVWVQQ